MDMISKCLSNSLFFAEWLGGTYLVDDRPDCLNSVNKAMCTAASKLTFGIANVCHLLVDISQLFLQSKEVVSRSYRTCTSRICIGRPINAIRVFNRISLERDSTFVFTIKVGVHDTGKDTTQQVSNLLEIIQIAIDA